MTRKIYNLLLLLTLFSFNTGFAQTFVINAEKIPTTYEQVIVTLDGIFLNLEDQLVEVSGVIEEDGFLYGIKDLEAWYCDFCKKYTPYPKKRCIWCGRER